VSKEFVIEIFKGTIYVEQKTCKMDGVLRTIPIWDKIKEGQK